MTIVDILAVVVPPCAAFAYHSYTRVKAREISENATTNRQHSAHMEAKSRELSKEQQSSLAELTERLDHAQARIAAAELQLSEHHRAINNLNERSF